MTHPTHASHPRANQHHHPPPTTQTRILLTHYWLALFLLRANKARYAQLEAAADIELSEAEAEGAQSEAKQSEAKPSKAVQRGRSTAGGAAAAALVDELVGEVAAEEEGVVAVALP